MTKQEIIDKVMESPYENWTYFDEYGEFTLNDDVAIRIIHDDSADHDFVEDWTERHPDKHATMKTFYIFYNASRVESFYLVSVDGGRATIPMPMKAGSNVISKRDYLLGKTVDHNGRMDEYIRRSKLVVKES